MNLYFLRTLVIANSDQPKRYKFYKDFIQDVKYAHDANGEATIAQEIKNGLCFNTIAQCIQYIEDLFAPHQCLQAI